MFINTLLITMNMAYIIYRGNIPCSNSEILVQIQKAVL